ncbi:hypothetical protein BH18ACT17_BH18ACT17_01520 [soil metagenome]
MKRSELAHVLRAASTITDDPRILVIGSQAILGSFGESELPEAAIRSVEVDVAFFDDPHEAKSDAVDGAIGELASFHETHGFYAQGVAVSTAVFPIGWEERVVPFDDPESEPSCAVCLEPHDLVVSKLVAGREKDFVFARALVEAGFVDVAELEARAGLLPVIPAVRRCVIERLPGRSR